MSFLQDDNVQQKLTRVRPPRVKITYDVETGDAQLATQLPFIVGIFANLAGDAGGPANAKIPYRQRQFIEIDRDNIYDVMKASGASVDLSSIDLPEAPRDATKLVFTKLDDFQPMSVVQQVPRLAKQSAARNSVRGLQARAEIDDALAATLDYICAPKQGALRAAIAEKYTLKQTNDGKAPSQADIEGTWRALGVTPVATGQWVAPGALTAANVVEQLMGHLVTTQPAAATSTQATPAQTQATPAQTQETPAQTQETPAQTQETPAQTQETPAQTQETPAQTQETPAQTQETKTPPPANAQGATTSTTSTATATPAAPDWQDALVAIGYFNSAVLSAISAQTQPTTLRATQWIDVAVSQIDTMLSQYVDVILHSQSFQALEATWRSLASLVSNTETGDMLKLKVFDTTRDELSNDLETAVEFDQSVMFKLIYEAEYGTLGGNPFSVLLGDFMIGKSANDIEFLNKMTQVAAAAHAPLIAGTAPDMFGLDDYSQLGKPRDLAKIFEGIPWVSFREFRQTEDSRYATLVLPRVLLRLPYDYTVTPVGFNYIEDVSSDKTRPSTNPADPNADQTGTKFVNIDADSGFLWGNAAYALTQRITNAFALYQWVAAIRGEEGGGLVDGLPLYEYRTDRGSDVLFCPTEVAITDRREKELSDLGFMALCHSKGSSKAVFFGGQTVNQPLVYLSDEANANAQLSARLPYMLAASRFAHYVKVIVRRKTGGFQSRQSLQAFLNNWIAQYVLLDDNATQDVKASYPLRSARIVVTDVPGAPGSYKATLFLKPHFQLEELTASIRLVADLPAAN